MKLVLVSTLVALLGCGSSGNAPRDAARSDSSANDAAPSERQSGAPGADATDVEVVSDASDAHEAAAQPEVGVEHGGAEAGLDAHDAAGADSACAAGCTAATTTATFCMAGETQWTCQSGKFNPTSFNAYCRDAGTDAIRYCCPPSFVPLCD